MSSSAPLAASGDGMSRRGLSSEEGGAMTAAAVGAGGGAEGATCTGKEALGGAVLGPATNPAALDAEAEEAHARAEAAAELGTVEGSFDAAETAISGMVDAAECAGGADRGEPEEEAPPPLRLVASTIPTILAATSGLWSCGTAFSCCA